MAITEDITLRLKIDKSDISGNLNTITGDITKLKEEQVKLNQAYKDGKISAEEYAKQSKLLSTEIGNLNSQATSAAKAINAEKGSIDELSAALQLNRKAYNSLSQEQRENEKVGGKLRKTINDQQNSLNDLNKSVGKPGLRGGLIEAFGGMAKSLGAAGLAFLSIDGAVKAFKYGIAQSADATDTFEQVVAGVKSTVQSLAADLMNLDFAGMFKRAVDAAKTAADLEKQRQAGEDRAYAMSIRKLDLQNQIIDQEEILSNLARKNLSNAPEYIAALEKINKLKEEQSKIDTKIAKNAYDLALADPAVRNKEQVARALKMLQDLSYDEVKLLQQFNEAAEKRIDMRLKMQNAPTVKPSGGYYGAASASMALIETKAEIQPQLDEAERAYQEAKDKFLNVIREKKSTDATAFEILFEVPDAAREKLFANYKAYLEAYLRQKESQLAGNKAITDLNYKVEKEASDKSKANQKDRLEFQRQIDKDMQESSKKHEEDMIKTIDESIEKQNELEDQKLADDIERFQRKLEAEKEADAYIAEYRFMARQLSLQNETVAEEERIAFEAEAEKERARAQQQELLDQLKLSYNERQMTLEEYAQREKDIKKATADYEVEVEKDKNKRIAILKREALAASLQTSVEFLSTTVGVFNELMTLGTELNKETIEQRKMMLATQAAASIADIWINYSVAASKGFAQMGPILGIAPAAVMTASAVASTALVLAKTAVAFRGLNIEGAGGTGTGGASTSFGSNLGQKFEKGGPIYGNTHAGGGVKIEAEGGEFIINKRAMKNPMVAILANFMNQFGDGGPVIRDLPPIMDPINIPIGGMIPIDSGLSVPMPTYNSGKLSPSSSLSISGSRGSGSFIARASYGSSYSGGSYSATSSNSSVSNLSGLAAEVAAAIQAIPVYIVESEMTGMQRKVQVREQKFTI